MANESVERTTRRFRAVVGEPHSRRRRAIAALAIATVLLFVLAGFADEIWDHVVEDASSLAVDIPVQDWMVAHRVPGFTGLVSAFSISGGPLWMPIIVGLAAVVLAVLRRSWAPLVLTVLAAAGSLLMTIVGKSAVGRERPPIADSVPPYETSFSFPSGHSLNSIVLACMIGYLVVIGIRSRVARAFVIAGILTYVVAMGASRIYLGHHWVSDVLMAWVLGAAWLTILITAHRLWLTARVPGGRRRAEPVGATVAESGAPDEPTTAARPASLEGSAKPRDAASAEPQQAAPGSADTEPRATAPGSVDTEPQPAAPGPTDAGTRPATRTSAGTGGRAAAGSPPAAGRASSPDGSPDEQAGAIER